jgi:hypothetical protein
MKRHCELYCNGKISKNASTTLAAGPAYAANPLLLQVIRRTTVVAKSLESFLRCLNISLQKKTRGQGFTLSKEQHSQKSSMPITAITLTRPSRDSKSDSLKEVDDDAQSQSKSINDSRISLPKRIYVPDKPLLERINGTSLQGTELPKCLCGCMMASFQYIVRQETRRGGST